MIQHGQKKTYPAGTLIFAQGEYGDTAFLIERGRVGVFRTDVVAEGVEEPHHFALLRQLGCSKGQGYHFSRPLPQPEAEALLRSGRRWATGGAA